MIELNGNFYAGVDDLKGFDALVELGPGFRHVFRVGPKRVAQFLKSSRLGILVNDFVFLQKLNDNSRYNDYQKRLCHDGVGFDVEMKVRAVGQFFERVDHRLEDGLGQERGHLTRE